MNMDEYFALFREYMLVQKPSSVNTRDSYLRDISAFLSYLADENIASPLEVETETVEAYVQHLHSLRLPKKNGRTSSSVKLEKEPKKLPQTLTSEEIDLLLSQPNVTEAKGCRDKAMLELLYATGIRVSELINLNVQDINLRTGKLFCRGTKGVRTIPIYAKAVVAVSDYLYRMRDLIVDPDNSGDALFVNLNGSRLTRQGFWKIIKAYTAEAGITKEITPHTLRHSFAIHLLQGGASVKDIQTMMGHADISSTQVYVHLLDLDNHVKNVYNECHPRAKTS